MDLVNYLAQSDSEASCGGCGRELRHRAFFCDRCGRLDDRVDQSVVDLVELHRNGTLDDAEYVAALRIQREGFLPEVTVVRPPGPKTPWTQTRIGKEMAALSAVVVAIGGFMAGMALTEYRPLGPAPAPAAVALDDRSGPLWDQEDLADVPALLERLDRFWQQAEPGAEPSAPGATDIDNGPAGCSLTRPADWCSESGKVVYSSRALATLTQKGGNGLAAAVLTQVTARRFDGAAAELRDEANITPEADCLVGAAVAELDDGSGGDALLALLRSYAYLDPGTDFGVLERSLAAADGYRNGRTRCSSYASTGSGETRFDAPRTTNMAVGEAVRAAISASSETFVGIEKTRVQDGEMVAGGCDLGEAYAQACGDGIAYNPVRLAVLADEHGDLAPLVPVVMAYTALQQSRLRSDGDSAAQFCAVGAVVQHIQESNMSYGPEISAVVIPDLDSITSLIIDKAASGTEAVSAVMSVWTGYRSGAAACL